MSLKQEHKILIVDDEKPIANSLCRVFHREKFKTATALNGEEGLALLREAEEPFSLILSDQKMPGMTGSLFLEKAKEIMPDSVRMLLTGYADINAVIDAVNRGEIHRYVSKPWDDDELVLQVRMALEHYELVLENRRLLDLTQSQNAKLSHMNKNLERRVEERTSALLLKNKRLSGMNRELEAALFNTVRAFTSLTEMHSPKLAGHGRRVSLLAREIAEFLSLPESDINQIEVAGLLHDLGKLGLPPKILDYNRAAWNAEDQALYEQHTEAGQEIICFINRLDHAGALVRSHHERYDGQGFPDHFSDESIPLGSRILAVADAWDKLTEMKMEINECIKDYKKNNPDAPPEKSAQDLEWAAAAYYLKKRAFIHFDPDVVKAFLVILKRSGGRCKKEKGLRLAELEEGMLLSRPLYSSKGRFLLSYNTRLTQEILVKMAKINKIDPITDRAYIQV
ncbi:MAG: HD domain-containing phosphohydrolase [Planctomycetota bacterium]